MLLFSLYTAIFTVKRIVFIQSDNAFETCVSSKLYFKLYELKYKVWDS